ncbi:solute carrier family 25 protein [archaeon]|nr:MAG: solute carrier family 25 protein [archaeon]
MLGSATAGMIARIPCHPIDTVKARLQVQTQAAGSSTAAAPYRNFVHALGRVYHEEGVRGLYRGFPITFMGSAPGTLLYFTSYDIANRTLPRVFPWANGSSVATSFSAGMIAEAVSCLFWVPIDVIKERMQIQHHVPPPPPPPPASTAAAAPAAVRTSRGMPLASEHAYYRSTRHAVRVIMASEGLRGLYKGYGATLASFGPFSAFYFAFYERFKSAALVHVHGSKHTGGDTSQSIAPGDTKEEEAPLPLLWQVLTASSAGAAASVITNPLDMVKLRLQVQRAAAAVAAAEGRTSSFQYTGMADALRQLVSQEGWPALLRGAGARVAFHAPTTALTMTLFEQCKHWFERTLPDV